MRLAGWEGKALGMRVGGHSRCRETIVMGDWKEWCAHLVPSSVMRLSVIPTALRISGRSLGGELQTEKQGGPLWKSKGDPLCGTGRKARGTPVTLV